MTMSMALAFRRSICRLLFGVLVSTQLVMVVHACPGSSRLLMRSHEQSAGAAIAELQLDAAARGAPTPGSTGNPGDGTDAGCTRIDPAPPNLSIARGQCGQHSTDLSAVFVVPAVLMTPLYTLSPLGEIAERIGPASRASSSRAVADPPHATLHCCLRI